jgi:uncharacterized protein YegP (UPF0339 family)
MKFELYQCEDDLWGWRLRAGDNDIVAACEGYTREADARRAVDLVKANAADAPVEVVK